MPERDGCLLRAPNGPEEWQAYHDIRRRGLFEPYLPAVAYDPDHPDERAPSNHPLVLLKDGAVVGSVRVDLIDGERAALRLFVVHPERQRQGHGAALLALAEDFIRRHGRRRAVLHANPAAAGFYLRHGYSQAPWPDDPPLEDDAVDLAKTL